MISFCSIDYGKTKRKTVFNQLKVIQLKVITFNTKYRFVEIKCQLKSDFGKLKANVYATLFTKTKIVRVKEKP